MRVITKQINKTIAAVSNTFLSPEKPAEHFVSGTEKFTDRLTYESSFEDEDRTVFLLSDNALGTFYELTHIPHEINSESRLQEHMREFAKIFKKIESSRVTFQFIFDQQISEDFPAPEWDVDSYARKVMQKRVEAIKELARNPKDRPPLYRRKIYLTLRVECKESILSSNEGDLAQLLEKESEILHESLVTLRDYANTLEKSFLSSFAKPLQKLGEQDLVKLLRETLHGSENRSGVFFKDDRPRPEFERISSRVLNGSVEWDASGVGVGADTWEALSWSGQPQQIYPGVMTRLMEIKAPLRCVVNIRPTNYTADLESLSAKIQEGDPYQNRQKKDVDETEDRVVGGEKLLDCSLHVLIRSTDAALTGRKDLRQGQSIARDIEDAIPVFLERFTAFPVFMVCLPFQFSSQASGFIGRERRILSDDIGFILPVFGGTLGSKKPKQLMQARSGEAIYLNQRAGKSNPHFAVFGASQSGKSFWFANFLMSEFAYNPDTMVFLIDSKTSVEYLGKALGEDLGFQMIKPPESYPNLFRGELTKPRVTGIIEVIKTSLSLISGISLDSTEETILAEAIYKTYEDNHQSSGSRYIKSESPDEVGVYESTDGKVALPRMSDIANKLKVVAGQMDITEARVDILREKLLPFFGKGPYAEIFDQQGFEQPDVRAPGLTIYDLDAMSEGPVRTIVTLILIAEIERQIRHPLNRGRNGCLIVEEAGDNLKSKSPQLAEYIKSAYTRFAKIKVSCGAITNKIEHYTTIPACRTAWGQSSTNIILPVYNDSERSALPELLKNDYLAELACDLKKEPGAFSEFLWLGDEVRGTVSYVPTGYDYWLAINHSEDVDALTYAFEIHRTWQKAIDCLAELRPLGFRDDSQELYFIGESEKRRIKEWAN